jgi:phage anti-repressor protein
MTEALIQRNFIAPHYITELGEEGLTLHEIAQSLGIQLKHAKEALEKNLNDYSAVEISTQQEIREVTGHSYNRKVNSYVLTTEDAKFFVAGYNNDIGKSYRRYLIQCEKAVHKLAQRVRELTPHEKALNAAEVFMKAGELFGAPRHLVQIEAIKEAKRYAGVDLSPVLQLSPAQDNIPDEEEMLEPTELATRLGVTNAMMMNRRLKDLGLQVRTRGGWEPTSAGKSMCIRHAWKSGDKSGYNLKWNYAEVLEMIGEGT